jgi:hypothetical protein
MNKRSKSALCKQWQGHQSRAGCRMHKNRHPCKLLSAASASAAATMDQSRPCLASSSQPPHTVTEWLDLWQPCASLLTRSDKSSPHNTPEVTHLAVRNDVMCSACGSGATFAEVAGHWLPVPPSIPIWCTALPASHRVKAWSHCQLKGQAEAWSHGSCHEDGMKHTLSRLSSPFPQQTPPPLSRTSSCS